MQPTNLTINNKKAAPCKPLSNTLLGILLVAAGLLIALYRLNTGLPVWLVAWPVLLTGLGLALGFYHRFKGFIWMVPIFWGGWLVAQLQFPALNLGSYTAEASIILAGLIILLVKRGPYPFAKFGAKPASINIYKMTAVLRNARASITAKDFIGADVTCVLGNARLNLQDADTAGGITVDTAAVLGNAKIYIPAGWTVQNDITTIFGEVKQRCIQPNATAAPGKVIKFDGTAIFGNIEIISC